MADSLKSHAIGCSGQMTASDNGKSSRGWNGIQDIFGSYVEAIFLEYSRRTIGKYGAGLPYDLSIFGYGFGSNIKYG